MCLTRVSFMPHWTFVLLTGALTLFVAQPASAAAKLKATYLFNDTFNAEEVSAPALTAVNPLGQNQFETDTVFGQTRRVYHLDGNPAPLSEQAGLTLDTTGLIPTNNYSVEIVFKFVEGVGIYKRVLDVQNRTSDDGLYVRDSEVLNVVPVAGGSSVFTQNVFHHVVVTNAPGATSTVKGYLDGALEFTVSTNVMNINNPNDLMNFFLDDGAEWADNSRVALIRIYEGVLTDSEVDTLASDPFRTAIVPVDIKPGSYPNSIKLGSGGTTPVAILSTQTFDAPMVDPLTIRLAGAQVRLKGNGQPQSSITDVNGDGRLDLVVHVVTEALELSASDTEAVLVGETYDGIRVVGVDTVRIVP